MTQLVCSRKKRSLDDVKIWIQLWSPAEIKVTKSDTSFEAPLATLRLVFIKVLGGSLKTRIPVYLSHSPPLYYDVSSRQLRCLQNVSCCCEMTTSFTEITTSFETKRNYSFEFTTVNYFIDLNLLNSHWSFTFSRELCFPDSVWDMWRRQPIHSDHRSNQ